MKKLTLCALLAALLVCMWSAPEAMADGIARQQGYYLDDAFVPYGDVIISRGYGGGAFYNVYGVGSYSSSLIYPEGPLKITSGTVGAYSTGAAIHYYDGAADKQVLLPFVDLRTDASRYAGWRYGTSKDDINSTFQLVNSDSDDYLLGTRMPLFPSGVINDQLPLYVAYVGTRFYSVTFHIPEGVGEETSVTYTTVAGGSVTPPALPGTHQWDSEAYKHVNSKLDIYAVSLCNAHSVVSDPAVPATCTETGLTSGSHCAVCNEVIMPRSVVPAKGHTVVVDAAVAPSGGNTGLSEGSHCAVCGTVFVPQRVVNATGRCGASAQWDYDAECVLRIHGSGQVTGQSSASYDFPAGVRSGATRIEIQEGIAGIADSAFSGFTGVKSISIPASVTSMTGKTFYNCGSLTEISVATDNPAFASVDGCLYDKAVTRLIRCPEGLAGTLTLPDVSGIGTNAFSGCTKLDSVVLSYNVTDFDDGCFAGRGGSMVLSVPEDSAAQDYASKKGVPCQARSVYKYTVNDSGVTITGYMNTEARPTRLTIPASINGQPVVAVGEYGFDYYDDFKNVKEIILPDTVTRIGSGAFAGCMGLERINFPNTLEYIGEGAIGGHPPIYAAIGSSLAKALGKGGYSFRVQGKQFVLRYIYSTTYNPLQGLALVRVDQDVTELEVPQGVEIIYCDACSDMANLSSVTLPDTLTTIVNRAFNNCNRLHDIILPASVINLYSEAFLDCDGLESVSVLNGECKIATGAFRGCDSLRLIHYGSHRLRSSSNFTAIGSCGPDMVWYANIDGVLSIKGQGDMPTFSYDSDRYGVTTNIPWYSLNSSVSRLDIEEGITSISANAFCNLRLVKAVYLPKSIRSIGSDAFWLVTASVYYTPTADNRALVQNYGGTLTWVRPSGSCGDNATWTMEDENTLRLLGTGTVSEATWLDISEVITTVVAADQLGGIAGGLLDTLPNLNSIIFDGSRPALAEDAFSGVSATAYFLHTADWPEESLHNYGGNLTWQSFCNRAGSEINTGYEAVHVPGYVDCTEVGCIDHWQCSGCGLAFRDEGMTQRIPDEELILSPTGHDWEDTIYLWSEDNTTVTASRVCRNNAEHVETETAIPAVEITKASTCAEAGEQSLTAVYINEAFETQRKTTTLPIDPNAHAWEAPVYTWSDDDQPAATATRVCRNSVGHVDTETVVPSIEITRASTCVEAGKRILTAVYTNEAFETQTRVTAMPVDPDAHAWGDVRYTWSDDGQSVTATRQCGRDETHVETETVTTTAEVTKPATCTGMGETTYTSAAFQNEAFTVQAKTLENVDALGHDWGEATYTWSDDNKTVTATHTCKHDAEHTEIETAQTKLILVKAPTDNEKGETRYTASFDNAAYRAQTKTVSDVPALGEMSIMYLPAMLDEIDEEAFMGLAAEGIIIPDGCMAIGPKAFANCPNLIYIRIPSSVTTIAEDAFKGSNQVRIDRAE